jgi:biopolymer transport protein ExbB
VTVRELLEHGGWAMYPLYACSLLAVTIFIRKVLELRAARLWDLGWLEPALEEIRSGALSTARQRCEGARQPVARVVGAVLAVLERRPERAEAEAIRVGSLELQALERHVSALSFVSQVAPLLGLLGTVLGMVSLFLALQGTGTGRIDAALLSGGIWKALLTTAAGLVVAVPSLAGHALLTSRTDRLRLQIADVVQRVLTAAPPTRSAP